MEYHSLSSLHVNVMSLNSLSALSRSTIELSKPVVRSLGTIPASALSYLEIITQSLVASMNKNQKSGFTDNLKLMDKDRDSDISEIKRVTSSYLKSSNAAKKAASSTLQLFLAPYWHMATLDFNTETGVVGEMIAKYKLRPDLLTAAQTLGIDDLFVSLETKNTAFDNEFNSRNAEYSVHDLSASSLKSAVVNAYCQYCTAIEQAVNYSPNDNITALFNKMDELRKNYHALESGSATPAAPDAPTK